MLFSTNIKQNLGANNQKIQIQIDIAYVNMASNLNSEQ